MVSKPNGIGVGLSSRRKWVQFPSLPRVEAADWHNADCCIPSGQVVAVGFVFDSWDAV